MWFLLSKWSQPSVILEVCLSLSTTGLNLCVPSCSLPLVVHVQPNWAGWGHFSWQRESSAQGMGALEKPLSLHLSMQVSLVSHLGMGRCHQHWEMLSAPLACVRGTHGSLFSMAPK